MRDALTMEYCVMFYQDDEPHRGPWPLERCEALVKAFEDDGAVKGTWYVAKRVVTAWQRV